MRKLLALLLLSLCAGLVVFWLSRHTPQAALGTDATRDETQASPGAAALSGEPAAQASAPESAPESAREALEEDGARAVEATAPPQSDAQFFGRVVSFDTKAPIAGASVQLVSFKMFSNSTGEVALVSDVLAKAKTDEDGKFELSFSSSAQQVLRVEARGYAPARVQIPQNHLDPAHAFVVELYKECTLIVHVIDASGSDVAGVSVNLDSFGRSTAGGASAGAPPAEQRMPWVPDQHWSASTKKDGRVTIRDLPPAVKVRARVVRNYITLWAEPEPIELEPGESRELEFRITTGTRVSGSVIDQRGDPVARQRLWISKRHSDAERYFEEHNGSSAAFGATTDAAGRFVFEDVAAGRWSLGPAAEKLQPGIEVESAIAPRTVAIDLAGEPTREVTLRVDRGLYIRGTVTAPDHGSVRGAHVNFRFGSPLGTPVTPQGSFVFGPLAEGECTLVASCMGRYADSDPLRVRAGDSGVQLQLKFGGGLSGQLIDATSGQPCKGNIVLSAELPDRGVGDVQSGTSVNADGQFGWPALAPGRYAIAALTEDGRCAVQSGIVVSAGVETAGIVLALKPGGWIHLSYHGKKDLMSVVVRSAGVPLSFPLWIRSNKESGVCAPAGTVLLEIREEYDDTPRTQQVELKAGETKEIVITDED